MIKIKIFTTFFLILGILAPLSVNALELTSRSTLELDESILKDDSLYSNPTDILVVPITINKEFSLTESEWYKGVYYYTVDRLGFADMPYHYLITESGLVYKGNKFGDEKQVSLTDFSSSSVIIGYLNKGNTTNIDSRAEKSFKELILQIANYNNINPNKTAIRNLRFKRNKDAKTIEVVAEKAFGNWESSVSKLVNSISGFAPIAKEYSAQVTSITLPTDQVDPGQEITVSVQLKNTGQNGNYADSNSEIILSKNNGGASIFYVNNVWSSQTQTLLMTEGQTFLPGQELKFDFKIKAPLYVGEVSEQFELKTFSGAKIQSDAIEIKVNVKKTDKQIVAIKNNTAGFSNVYYQAYTSSGVALRAAAGTRFFLLEQNNQTLWAKLDLGNGQTGWIAIWNLSYL